MTHSQMARPVYPHTITNGSVQSFLNSIEWVAIIRHYECGAHMPQIRGISGCQEGWEFIIGRKDTWDSSTLFLIWAQDAIEVAYQQPCV